jgi:hypothetical protein
MGMRIETEKCTVRGIQCRKVTGIEGVKTKESLPAAYSTHEDAIMFVRDWRYTPKKYDGITYIGMQTRLDGDTVAIVDYQGCHIMSLGDIFHEADFQQRLVWITRAAKLLTSINERLRKENMDWKGNETFVI